MAFRHVGRAADELEMVSRAQVEALGFEGLLSESKDAGAEVCDFCKKLREASSIHGQQALKSWGANSADYIHLAGWMNCMASWLRRCEAFGNLLGLQSGDETYLKGAAQLMGLLHTWSQTISLALPQQQDEAA